MDHKDLIRAAECCDLKDCEDCPSKGRVCCRERTMQELAAALKNEILRAEAAEADNERLREAIKPNCLMCESMHPDNGNCTEVGGFCTAVLAAHCPMIPRLRERAEAAEARAEKAERERDAAVSDLTFAVNQYRLLTTDIDLCGLCAFDFPPGGENGQDYECPGFYEDNCFKWRGEKEEWA